MSKENCCLTVNGHGWGLAENDCIPCFKFDRDYLDPPNFTFDKPTVASDRDLLYSTCMGFGPSYWRTFDGLEFLFPGRCSYLLWNDDYHRVTVHMVDCHSYVQCTKILKISTYLEEDVVVHGSDIVIHGIKITVDFNRPFISPANGITIKKIGDYFFLEHGTLRLQWDAMNTFFLSIEQSEALSNISKSVGLCGNNNTNPFDDNERVSDPTKLGNSWMVNDTGVPCLTPAPSVTYMCHNKEDEKEAIDACGVLWLPPFNICHQTVLVKHYFAYCVNDYCAAKTSGMGDNKKKVDVDGEIKAALCQTLTAYGQICSSLNVTFEWRTKDLCPVKCPMGMIYHECWSRCIKTCNSALDPRSVECNDKRCYPGCNCQDGWFLTENTCVVAEECPCSYQGTTYKARSTIDMGCSQCKCTGGGWTCQDLECPKTCSIIGYQHISTFDGKDYEFHGPECWYTLVELKPKEYAAAAMLPRGDLSISYSQIKCLSRTDISCINSVRVSYRRGSSSYDVILERSRNISVNGVIRDTTNMAYVTADIYVKQMSSLFAMVQGFGYRVLFDASGKLYIRLDNLFSEKVRGLCGNMDGSIVNDFLSRNNVVEQLLPFVKSFSDCALIWPVDITLEEIDPCARKPNNPMIFQTAADLCKQITAPNGVFSKCLKVINWMNFINFCIHDVCANPLTNIAFCNVVSGLAYKCLMVGVEVDWMMEKGLSSACQDVTGYGCQPHTQKYSDCASKITRCQEIQFRNPVPDNDDCIPGCSCLENKLINNLGQCVRLEDCTCYDRYTNKSYKAGEKLRHLTNECTCNNATFVCNESNHCDGKSDCELTTTKPCVTSLSIDRKSYQKSFEIIVESDDGVQYTDAAEALRDSGDTKLKIVSADNQMFNMSFMLTQSCSGSWAMDNIAFMTSGLKIAQLYVDQQVVQQWIFDDYRQTTNISSSYRSDRKFLKENFFRLVLKSTFGTLLFSNLDVQLICICQEDTVDPSEGHGDHVDNPGHYILFVVALVIIVSGICGYILEKRNSTKER